MFVVHAVVVLGMVFVSNLSFNFVTYLFSIGMQFVGLFVVNGDVMCKRYIKQGRGSKLVPDNPNGKHKSFGKKDIISYKLIGKVLI